MIKYLLVFILCLCTVAKINAQKKFWQTIVFTNRTKDKGILKEANDSALVLLTKSGEETLLYNDITRLKFTRTGNTATKIIGGSIVGATLGATITASQLSKGKTGEPGALAGVVGGIGGGIVGGIVGAFTAPIVCNLLSARKINLEHNAAFYQSLRLKLQSYVVK